MYYIPRKTMGMDKWTPFCGTRNVSTYLRGRDGGGIDVLFIEKYLYLSFFAFWSFSSFFYHFFWKTFSFLFFFLLSFFTLFSFLPLLLLLTFTEENRGGLQVLSGKESACQCRRHRFDPWVGKTPLRRRWQSAPVFLLVKSDGQRSLVG